MSKRKVDEASNGGRENDDNLDDLFGFDPMETDDEDQIAKRPRTSSPQISSDDESLPLSPSAFRFEYREPAKEIPSSSPIRDTTPTTVSTVSEGSTSIHTSLDAEDVSSDHMMSSDEEGTEEENVSSYPTISASEEEYVVESVSSDHMMSSNGVENVEKDTSSDPTTADDTEENIEDKAIILSIRCNLLLHKWEDDKTTGPSGLPKEVLANILIHVLPVDKTIKPWYKFGMSTQGIRGWSKNDEGITFKPNIDASYLRVNKEFHEVGTDVLYGSNHFLFAGRPYAARWFLDRIGDHNIQKIRMADFEMNTGWRADRRDSEVYATDFENSFEEDWAKVLGRFQKLRVPLKYLGVTTKFWTRTELEPDYKQVEDKIELNFWRAEVVRRLWEFRGVEKAIIREDGDSWIGRLRVQALTLLVQQR